MKISSKVITFTIFLSGSLSFSGIDIVDSEINRSKTPERIDTAMYDRNLRNIACAASAGKNQAGDHDIKTGVSIDKSDDSGTQEDGCVTLLRKVSVVAMAILLVWYIRKRIRL